MPQGEVGRSGMRPYQGGRGFAIWASNHHAVGKDGFHSVPDFLIANTNPRLRQIGNLSPRQGLVQTRTLRFEHGS
jgi:hypothetical protein